MASVFLESNTTQTVQNSILCKLAIKNANELADMQMNIRNPNQK